MSANYWMSITLVFIGLFVIIIGNGELGLALILTAVLFALWHIAEQLARRA